MFDYDATGIEASNQGQNKLLPKKWFAWEIVSYVTKDGSKEYPLEGYTTEKKYPKVDFLAEVIDDPEFNGSRVFHSVTFMPKETDGKQTPGAGMAIHFLKTIGQPYEGKISPNSEDWVGAKFLGYALEDEYKGKKKNKIGEIKVYEPKKDGIPF